MTNLSRPNLHSENPRRRQILEWPWSALTSSARRHDLDVGVYIKDVLDRLLAGTTDYRSLLPDVWKQTRPEAIRVYRVEERRDKAERKQLHAARRRLAARGQQ